METSAVRNHSAKATRNARRITQLALPDHNNLPSVLAESPSNLGITVDVRHEFVGPEIHVRLWHIRKSTLTVAVPKTSVDQNDRSVFWQHDIGLPEHHATCISTKSKAGAMQHRSDQLLGTGIARPNPRHIPATMFL
jgi:hypothetical protein